MLILNFWELSNGIHIYVQFVVFKLTFFAPDTSFRIQKWAIPEKIIQGYWWTFSTNPLGNFEEQITPDISASNFRAFFLPKLAPDIVVRSTHACYKRKYVEKISKSQLLIISQRIQNLFKFCKKFLIPW